MRSLVVFIPVGFLAIAALASGSPDRPESGLINTLDRCFQERFEAIDEKQFGLARIPTTPQHGEFRRFQPSTPAEKHAVGDLSRQGWDAVFMVASQHGLAAHRRAQRAGATRVGKPVSPPILLSTGESPSPGPTATALQDLQDATIADISRADRALSSVSSVSGWTLIKRAIPASKAECLRCHQTDPNGKRVRLGDALGLAIYGFRKRPTLR